MAQALKFAPEGGTKILRIGIIQNGKIVEERLVRKRENVTIGQSTKNTFVVPASNALPRTFSILYEDETVIAIDLGSLGLVSITVIGASR